MGCDAMSVMFHSGTGAVRHNVANDNLTKLT